VEQWWPALFAVLVATAVATTAHFDVGVVTIRPEQLALLLLVALAGSRFRRDLAWGWTEWVLVAFLVFQIVPTVLHAPSLSGSLRGLAQEILAAGAFLVVAAIAGRADRLATATRIFLGVTGGATAFGLIALLSTFALCTSWGVTFDPDLGGFAVKGLAQEHNLFGSMAAAGAIAFGVLWLERSPLFSRRLTAAGLSMCFLGLVASLTRGAWLGFTVAAVAAAGGAALGVAGGGAGPSSVEGNRRRPRFGRRGAAVASAVLVASGLLLWAALAKGPCPGPGGPAGPGGGPGRSVLNTESTSVRSLIWKDALADIRHSPVIGLGTNTFQQRHAWPVIGGPDNPLFLSNLFLRPLYDGGVVGLVLFLAFLVPLLWPGGMVRKDPGETGVIARAMVFAWIALAVAYVFTDATILIWPWIPLGLIRGARQVLGAGRFASLR
jgi:hypothetical protein